MSELYTDQELTPAEPVEMDPKEGSAEPTETENAHDSNDESSDELKLKLAQKTVALEEALLSLKTSDEVKAFIDTKIEGDTPSILYHYKDTFEHGGFGALHDDINEYIDDHRSAVDAYERAVDAQRIPAALAETALDDLQVNAPDVVTTQR